MPGLADLQDAMQRAILEGDDGILSSIPDSPRESRDTLLGIYRNAYVLRLAEVLRNDHGLLHAYLGDDTFDDMARAYIAAHPSRVPNARYFAAALPAFLAAGEPYAEHAQLAEIGAIEQALNDAFDAADAPVLCREDLARVAPEDWERLVLTPHPSARTLTLSTNALDIWMALSEEREPPEPETLAEPATAVAWRGAETAQVRPFPPEEAMMWREAAKGLRFGALCEMVATYDDADTAAIRASTHLAGWLAAGLLTAAHVVPPRPRRAHAPSSKR